jgi:transcriptional repressor NF-X1
LSSSFVPSFSPFFPTELTPSPSTACHFPSSCPTDSPCDKLIEVHCSCGHLSQKARCGSNDENPSGNQGRNIKCTSACDVAKRQAQLAEALGIEKKEAKVREVTPEPATLAYFEQNKKWAVEVEQQLIEFVKGDKPSLHFPAMKRDQRQFVRFLFLPSSLLSSGLTVLLS